MSLAQDVENLFVPGVMQFDRPYGEVREQPSTKMETQAAAQVLDPELALQPTAVMDNTLLSLGKLSVEMELDNQLSSGTLVPDVLADMQGRWASPGSNEAVVGMTKAVAGPEEDTSHITPKGISSDRLGSKRDIAQEYVDSVGYETALGRAGGVAETFLRGMNPVPTLEGDRLATLITKEFPDIGAIAYQNLGVAILMVRDKLEADDMSVDQARIHMASLSAGVRELSENGYHSIAQEGTVLKQLFGPMLNPGGNEALAAGLDSAGQNIDRIPFFNVLKAGKAAVKAGQGAAKAFKGVGTSVGRAGLVKGTAAHTVAQVKAGVEGLVSLVTSRASGGPVANVQGAAKTEDIIDSVALPQIAGKPFNTVPYIQNALVPAATRDALIADPLFVYGATGVKRINGAVAAEEVDGGISMSAMLGTKNGAPFKTDTAAKTANTRDFGGAGTIVPNPNGAGYFVGLTRQREYGLEQAGVPGDLTMPGYGVGKYIGKLLGGSGDAIKQTNVAARQTEVAEANLSRVMEPYMSLPAGSQRRVGAALDAGDEKEVVHTIADLRSVYKLNDKEILAYAAVRRAADVNLDLKNVRMWHKYTAAGWKGLDVAGRNQGVKVMTVDEAVFAAGGQPRGSIRAIDANTGAVTTLDTVQPRQTVVRLLTPTKTGERFAIIDQAAVKKIGDLPASMLPKKAGHLPRPYIYPHYVKRFVNGVAVETIRPARSQLEGGGLVAELKASNPDHDFRVVQARETREVADESEVEALNEAGLLWSSVRGPSRLMDASGGVRMPTVEDRIRQMVSEGGLNAGLAKWGDAQKIAWTAKWGSLFENSFAPGKSAGQLVAKAGVSDAEAVKRARYEAEFINNTLGVGNESTKGIVKSIGSSLGEVLYNTATRLDRLRGGTKGSALANDLRDIGDNLTGQSGRILANAKTLPYLLYIAGNPVRQVPLQMTLIPSYFGVVGAAAYGLKGGFSRDFAILMASGMTESGAKLAGKLGSDAELVALFRKSGISDSLEHHTMVSTIGTTGTTSSATRWGNGVDQSVKMLTNVGVGAGIRAEKASAWLIALNRHKTMHPGEAIDSRAQQSIAAFAEELSLNPNRTDQLPIQHGILGFFTQFMSMQVKQIGRVMQAIPGVPTGNLTKLEAQRMAGINLLTYGISGYGLTKLSDMVMNHPDMQGLQEDVREILADGLSNYVLDHALTLATSEKTDTAFSESFSPNAQLGGTLALVPGLAKVLVTGDWETLATARWQAPALGLSSNVAEAVAFSARIIGAPPLPTPESNTIKLAAITKKTAQLLPGLNNIFKMQVAMGLKAKMNGRGDPLVEASYGEALVALAGVKTKEEARIWELNALQSAPNLTQTETIEGIRDAAYTTSTWLLPLLDQWVDGKVSYQQAMQYIDTTNTLFFSTLPQEYHAEFTEALRKAVDGRWATRYDKLIQKVIDDAGTGKLPVTEDVINAIATRIPDAEKRERVTQRLNTVLFGVK